MKKILILYQAGQESHLKKIMSGYCSAHIIILETDSSLPDSLKVLNTSCRDYEDYLSYADLIGIDKKAAEFALTWYMARSDDISLFRDISLGQLTEYTTRIFMIEVFKNASFIEKAIESERPDLAVCVDDNSIIANLFIGFCRKSRLPCRRIRAAWKMSFSEKEYINKTRYILNNAKLIFMDFLWLGSSFLKGFNSRHPLKKRVFFEPYMKYHELAKILFDEEGCEILYPRPHIRGFSGIVGSENFAKAQIIYYPRFLNLIAPKAGLAYIKSRILIWFMWRRVKRDACVIDKFSSGGVNLWDYIKGNFRNYFKNYFPVYIRDIIAVERFMRRYKINTTLLPQDEFGLQRVLTCVAKKLGVLTIKYQHGVLNRYPFSMKPICHKLFAWSDNEKAHYLRLGVAEENIRVIGNPLMGCLGRENSSVNPASIRQRIGIPPGSRIVFFPSQPRTGLSSLLDPKYEDYLIAKIIETAGDIKEVSFIIKLHPWIVAQNQFLQKKRLIESFKKPNVFLVEDIETYEILKISDVVISESSTIGLEAIFLSKPLIAIYLRRILDDYFQPFKDYEGAIVVKDERTIAETIRIALYEPHIREGLKMGRQRILEAYGQVY